VATLSTLTDHDLVDLLKSDDKVAFMELYDRYHDTIFRFIRKYLRSSELSEDICQNVFLKIWEQRENPVTIMEFGAYVFTIAKRQCLDFLKRASVEQTAMGLILQNYSPNLTALEDHQQFRDYMAFIEKVLTTLPEQTQAVFRLCRQQYKTYDEAAEILGISRNTVKKHMVRSMKVLGEAAENELGVSFLIVLAILAAR
jgi:RNA polymerase sigma-70 factor (family 1)